MAFTALILCSQEILHLTEGTAGGVLGPDWITRLGPLRALYLALVLMIVPFAILAWTSSVALVALGALASGWIIAVCEPDIGREAALRIPYILAALVSLAMLVYGWRRIRV
jgi:hypothetical protein